MKKSANINKFFRGSIFILILLLLWQVLSTSGWLPNYLLPSPLDVIHAFVGDFEQLMMHSRVTLLEAAIGLFFGIVSGFLCAFLMDRKPFIRDALYPILVLTQTVPTVAIAPLLVLWMGYGIAPKVVLIVIVTFFPMAVNLYQGFAAADRDEIRLLRAMGATSSEVFTYVKLPNALEGFFSALKISASYSVVGAVIAEWLGGFQGLGVYMTRVKNAYSYDRMFAVIFLISFLSLLLMALVNYLQRKTMPWKQSER
ncbi:MAG: ABC transporter permease [Peptoniphilus sp.]|nr:ABC transporter permease [Peptoniphilus sp.]MDY6044584.1 ABC transporter permease [Peptoniphilus sp.]